MLVTPLPGANRDNLRETLRHLHIKAFNLRVPPAGARTRDWLTAYIKWVDEAVSALRGQVSARDVERLVLTKRYDLLASKVGMLY